MLLSIVIPTYTPEHLESKLEKFIRPQIKSFVRNTDMDGIEIIYVCNGCTNKIKQVLDEESKTCNIKQLWYDEGIGFTRATNEGIKASRGQYVLCFNDDAVILDYCPKNFWLTWLLNPMLKDKSVGMTGVHELFCNHSQAKFLIGYCVLIRRALLEQVGMFDEVFSPGAGEDTDLCIRARLNGWKVQTVDTPEHTGGTVMSGTFPIWHPGETTFHNWEAMGDFNPNSKWQKIFDRNSNLLKHRRESGYYDKPQPLPSTVELLPKLQG